MTTNLRKPELIDGGIAVDDRGQLSFVNSFSFEDVKRFYVVENFTEETIRAWHGHKKEAKYIFVIAGSAIVGAVEMDDVHKPNKENLVERFVLSARKPAILHIPAGYANGLKALEPGTKMVIFSTTTMEESKGDDYRFSYNYWGEDVWKIENR